MEIAGITTDARLRAVNGTRAPSLTGNLSIAGTVNSITLADAATGTISITGTTGSATIAVTNATGESLTSSESIQSIRSTSWAPATAGNRNIVPRVHRADYRLPARPGENIASSSVGTVSAGSITASTWTLTGSLREYYYGVCPGTHRDSRWQRWSNQFARHAITGRPSSIRRETSPRLRRPVWWAVNLLQAVATLDSNGIPTAFAAAATISYSNHWPWRVQQFAHWRTIAGADEPRRNITTDNGGKPFGLAAHQMHIVYGNFERAKRLTLRKVTSGDAGNSGSRQGRYHR